MTRLITILSLLIGGLAFGQSIMPLDIPVDTNNAPAQTNWPHKIRIQYVRPASGIFQRMVGTNSVAMTNCETVYIDVVADKPSEQFRLCVSNAAQAQLYEADK